MSIAETHRNLDDLARIAALECTKLGMIMRWRMSANQDRLDEGLAQCGCGCSPDEPEDDGRPSP